MAKLLKIIFAVLSALILLIVIAAVLLPMIIDPNDFKPEITAVVKKYSGRTLSIDGDLELSVFPWLGIATGKMSLSNAPGFPGQPFAVIEESNIKVKLLPLFSREIVVSRVVLKGLALNLARNRQGISNWDDFSNRGKRPESPATQPDTAEPGDATGAQRQTTISSLRVAGISIEDGAIAWDDQQSDRHIRISQLQLQTDSLAPDKPIAIDLAFNMLGGQPETSETIALSTDLTVTEQLDKFTLQSLHLKSITEGETIPGGKLTAQLDANIMIDTAAEKLLISDLVLNSGALTLKTNISGEKILTAASFQGPVQIDAFNPRQLLRQLHIEQPRMKDDKALTHLAMRFDLQATADSANLQNQKITLDDSNIAGSMQIKNFAQPGIHFNYHIDAIDLDRYLPEPVNEATDGDKKQPPHTTSNARQSAAPSSEQKTRKPSRQKSDALLPLETLRKLDATGRITIGTLKVQGLNMRDVTLQLSAKDGRISSQHACKHFYRGSYAGSLKINAQGDRPRLSLQEKITAIQIEPLLQDLGGKFQMTGTVNAAAALHSSGNNITSLKAALRGKLNFIAKDGVVKGISAQKIIDRGEALIKGKPLPAHDKNDQTPYSEISGSAKIINGVIDNDDFFVKSSSLRVNGKGTADLKTSKIDYQATAKLLKREATATTPEKIKGLPVIVDITGTFDKPVYTLDVKSMLTEKNKAKIEKQIDKLDKKYGVGGLLKGLLNKLEK